jgi:hypothetical protein
MKNQPKVSIQAADALAKNAEQYMRSFTSWIMQEIPWGEGDLAGELPDTWQLEIAKLIDDGCLTPEQAIQIAVSSGHGVGKTAFLSWVILWVMYTRPMLAGVVTANTMQQLLSKTWRELSVWHNRLRYRELFKWTKTRYECLAAPDRWFIEAVPWSKERSEAFAGMHARFVVIIFDEASAIDNVIWEVAEGATTTTNVIWLAFGNPTRNSGRFHDCFERFRHRWKTFRVDSRTARKANKTKINQWIEDYGIDSDFVRVRVLGLPPRQASTQFISTEEVINAFERPPARDEGAEIVIGVDIARYGDDDSCICVRRGRDVLEFKILRGLSTMAVANAVIGFIESYDPTCVFIDGGGVGGGVIDRLQQLRYNVVEVNNGNSPDDKDKYFNKGVEMWARMRNWIKTAYFPAQERDRLTQELTNREYGIDLKGRIRLESKEDMKDRGLTSPDMADSLSLTFAEKVHGVDVKGMLKMNNTWRQDVAADADYNELEY